jgi:hypothetical protein
MKAIAVSLTIIAASAWLCVAAYRLPWQGNGDFGWYWPGVGSLSLGLYGARLSWSADRESRYFDIFPGIPLLRFSVISHEAAALLRDDRAWHYKPEFDPEYYKLYKAAKAKDDAKEWRLPRR